jgi:hypothetical protein
MRQFPFAIRLDCAHEGVGHRDAHVEILEIAMILGVDEALDVGVVAAQDAHLRAAARAGGLHRLAALIEDTHVGDRPARRAFGAAHARALGAYRGKVVAHPAAAAHGFGRLLERDVNPGLAVHRLGDRVADRLHEAVDKGGLEWGARGGIYPAARDEAVLERFVENRLPRRRVLLDRGERARHSPAHVFDAFLPALGVFLQQHVERDLLRGKRKLSVVELHFSRIFLRRRRKS